MKRNQAPSFPINEAETHLEAFLRCFDLPEDELEYTVRKTTELFARMNRGKLAAPPTISTFETPAQDWVVMKGLRFHTLCAHHLVPFFGVVDVAILPNGRLAGFGSLIRTVAHFAGAPNLQEHLTGQICEHLAEALKARAVVVRSIARQLCVELQGHGQTPLTISTTCRGEIDGLEEALALLGPAPEHL